MVDVTVDNNPILKTTTVEASEQHVLASQLVLGGLP